jgi:septum formation protein
VVDRDELKLVLASASPARLSLLRAAGFDPEVHVSGVDESVVRTDDPAELSVTLARLKAQAVATSLAARGPQDGEKADGAGDGRVLVLGCDSVLAFDGQVLGKPHDPAVATARWKAMRGRQGVLHTGHHLLDLRTGKSAEEVGKTVVHFADVSDDEIAAYVGSGEPLQVAGAFTIDGLGGAFVERIEGDHGNVVGLSLPLLRRLLRSFDLTVSQLWAARRVL